MRLVLKSLATITAAIALLTVWAGPASAQAERLIVELNKFEAIDNGCRTFFLFRNQTVNAFQGFEMSLAILNDEGIIERLLTVDASPLPAERTTLKLFEIPETTCESVGEILLHEISRCETDQGGQMDCFDIVDLSSRTSAPLVK